MKRPPLLLPALAALSLALGGCASTKPTVKPEPAAAAPAKKAAQPAAAAPADDLDEYSAVAISDPFQPVNRGTFWFNHQLYRYVLKPVTKAYEFILPKPLRTGVYNVFDNVEYPVRFVNHTLQGNLKNAGLETGKFAVNTVVGVGGLMRPSDKIPALAAVPETDTGITFAKWGIGHGPYLVIPVIGPRSTRDTVGLAGDWALHPLTWVGIFWGSWVWTIPVSAGDTLAVMPDKLAQYEAARGNSVDPYLAVRSAYVQNRNEAARKAFSAPAEKKPATRRGSITVEPGRKSPEPPASAGGQPRR